MAMFFISWVLFFFTFFFISSIKSQNGEQIDQLNRCFLKAYQEKRSKLVESFDPLIITSGSQITLIHRGQNITFPSATRLYHNLKTLAHVPLGIFVSLFDLSSNDRNLTFNELNFIKTYLSEIRRTERSINIVDFDSNETLFQRQKNILDISIRFLRSILRSKYLKFELLRQYCSEMQRLFSMNIDMAARSHLNELHSHLYPWYRNRLNDTERSTVKALIIGPKAPRDGFLITQYLQNLLGDKSVEGKRFLYVENLSDIPTALNTFGTWFLDQYAAQAFFHDEKHLHRDVLKDSAAAYVKELFR